MQIELWYRNDKQLKLLKTMRTNSHGRTDQPLLSEAEMKEGNTNWFSLQVITLQAKEDLLQEFVF